MARKAEKEAMKVYIEGLVEGTGRYNIARSNTSHIYVAQKPELVEHPAQLDIALINQGVPIRDITRNLMTNYAQGVWTVPVVNKTDGLVYMGSRSTVKGNRRSLKRYSQEALQKMVHLRGVEKLILEKAGSHSTVPYYQPETDRLPESVRAYKFQPVMLDYSHVGEEHRSRGFAVNKTSTDYRIAQEQFAMLTGNLGFEPTNAHRKMLTMKQLLD